MSIRRAQFVAILLAAHAGAVAATTPFSKAVNDAAFEICPAFLTGEMSVNDAGVLKKIGFELLPAEAGKDIHPRFGKLQMISKKVSDRDLVITSAELPFCQVQWEGADGPEILAALKGDLITSQGYAEDTSNRGIRGGASYETFKKVLEPGAVAYFQLVSAPQSSGVPKLFAQISVLEK